MIKLMKEAARKIADVSVRMWLALFIISSLVCIVALRHDNQQMVKLRDSVYAADKNGGNINAALNNLSDYVHSHMNTNLSDGSSGIYPPIQLQYTYQRLLESQAAKLQEANQQVYSAAQAYCRSIGQTAWGLGTITCIQNYVVNHGVKSTANTNIPQGLYEFDFISPTWSPDLAGWSLLVSIILLIALLSKLAYIKFFAHKK
jgi:hypothetical protein